jgi:hypothetical protein
MVHGLHILGQHKAHVRSVALDGAFFDEPRHTQTLRLRGRPHRGHLFDGLVVGLALVVTGKGEIGDRDQDDGDADAKADLSFHDGTLAVERPGEYKPKQSFFQRNSRRFRRLPQPGPRHRSIPGHVYK